MENSELGSTDLQSEEIPTCKRSGLYNFSHTVLSIGGPTIVQDKVKNSPSLLATED